MLRFRRSHIECKLVLVVKMVGTETNEPMTLGSGTKRRDLQALRAVETREGDPAPKVIGGEGIEVHVDEQLAGRSSLASLDLEASPSPLLGSRGEVASRRPVGELEGDVLERQIKERRRLDSGQ